MSTARRSPSDCGGRLSSGSDTWATCWPSKSAHTAPGRSRRRGDPLPRFEPEALIKTLNRHGVDYVLIGGLAATLHGSTLRTGDADICPARDPDNLVRLAAALTELGARLRSADAPDGVPFPCDATFLSRVALINFTTRSGDLDVSFEPAGTQGYDDLRRHVVTYDLEGLVVPVASIDDIVRSKRAANRAKDLAALPELEALRDEMRRKKRHAGPR